jgi:hypothetical protein
MADRQYEHYLKSLFAASTACQGFAHSRGVTTAAASWHFTFLRDSILPAYLYLCVPCCTAHCDLIAAAGMAWLNAACTCQAVCSVAKDHCRAVAVQLVFKWNCSLVLWSASMDAEQTIGSASLV